LIVRHLVGRISVASSPLGAVAAVRSSPLGSRFRSARPRQRIDVAAAIPPASPLLSRYAAPGAARAGSVRPGGRAGDRSRRAAPRLPGK
jgi:hypothetical protein